MRKMFTFLRLALVILAVGTCFVTAARSQSAPSPYPIADAIAQKVIAHYEQSTCDVLWKEKSQPPSAQKETEIQKAVQLMHQDPKMRKYFLDKIAAVIVNKEFECGMIP